MDHMETTHNHSVPTTPCPAITLPFLSTSTPTPTLPSPYLPYPRPLLPQLYLYPPILSYLICALAVREMGEVVGYASLLKKSTT